MRFLSALLPSFIIYQPATSPFEPPSTLYTFCHHPLIALLIYLHSFLLALRGPPYTRVPHSSPVRVVCISDTHTKIPAHPVPAGDLLIHAGDLTDNGTVSEIQAQIDWLQSLLQTEENPSGFQHVVVICGNHDSYFDPRSRSVHDRRNPYITPDWGSIIYLEHTSTMLSFAPTSNDPHDQGRLLNIYGAPQIPKCGGREFAFQYPRGQDAWSDTIPDEVDILVTHAPPKWHLDIPENGGMGCEWLSRECWRVKPTLHVFGHVHAGGGQRQSTWWDDGAVAWQRLCERAYGSNETTTNKTNPKPATTRRRWFFGDALSELLDVRLWIMACNSVYEDVKGVLWTRLWGGNSQGGLLVNAALSYRSTGKLGNEPQVVIL